MLQVCVLGKYHIQGVGIYLSCLLIELEDLIAHDMFALLEAIQLSLKSRNVMPAQNSLHCTAQFIFMATHVTGTALTISFSKPTTVSGIINLTLH